MVKHHLEEPGILKWMVFLGAFFTQVLLGSVVYCAGVYFVMFQENIGGSSGMNSLVFAINVALFFLMGPIIGIFTETFGCRPVGLFGAVLSFLGIFTSIFVTSTWHLIFTIGIINGIGIGTIYIPSFAVIGEHFPQKHSLLTSMVVAGYSAGPIIFSPLIQHLEEKYGWRGATLIMSAIYAHFIPCAQLFFPVTRKNRNITKDINGKEYVQAQIKTNSTGLNDKQQKATSSLSVQHFNSKYSSKEFEINCQSALEDQEYEVQSSLQNTSTGKIFRALSLLKNIHFSSFCIVNIAYAFGLSVITTHLGPFSISLGYSQYDAAMLVLILAAVNTVTRIIFGAIIQVKIISAELLFILSVILSGIFTALYPQGKSYIFLAVFSGLMALPYGAYVTCILIVTNLTGMEQLPTAMGFLCTALGIGSMLGGPCAGWLYDATQDYALSFYLDGSVFIASALMMIPIWYNTVHATKKEIPFVVKTIDANNVMTEKKLLT